MSLDEETSRAAVRPMHTSMAINSDRQGHLRALIPRTETDGACSPISMQTIRRAMSDLLVTGN
jgi:hypothetical protein